MSAKWKAPEGFVLSKHEGYFIDDQGFRVPGKEKPLRPMPDGKVGVAHFDENEPFTVDNNPNCRILPIKDGWVPPVYRLHLESEYPGDPDE